MSGSSACHDNDVNAAPDTVASWSTPDHLEQDPNPWMAPQFQLTVSDYDNPEWSAIQRSFSDANIYQSWGFEAAREPFSHVVRVVLRRNDRLAAAAQVRLLYAVPRCLGVGYVFWGPTWRIPGQAEDADVFEDAHVLREMLRALRSEFVVNRRLVLRIFPRILDDAGAPRLIRAFEDEGFTRNPSLPAKRTLLIDLNPPLPNLRAGLDNRWRHHLKRAEAAGLTIVEGSGDELFTSFLPLYRELLQQKSLDVPNDFGQFRRMQKLLPHEHKLRLFLAQKDGRVCAGSIGAAVGNTGMTFFRAATAEGKELNAPYLVHWRMLEWIKSRGCQWYDLNGINPGQNPGVYKYKRGLCGRNGVDINYIGVFETFPSTIHRLLVAAGQRTLLRVRKGLLQWKWTSALEETKSRR